jgi:hypothetical protein
MPTSKLSNLELFVHMARVHAWDDLIDLTTAYMPPLETVETIMRIAEHRRDHETAGHMYRIIEHGHRVGLYTPE